MLTFLIEAGSDSVSFLEGHDQRWNRRAIVVAVFEGLPCLFKTQTGEPLHLPQMINPGPVGAVAVGAQQAAIIESPGDAWTTDSMAAFANMSRTAFCKHFREASGHPPMQFVTLIRTSSTRCAVL